MFSTLLLATMVAVVTAKDSYIIISPTTFRPGLPLNVSVNILKTNVPTVVTGEVLQNQTSVLAASGTFSQGITESNPENLLIMIPEHLSAGQYTLRVRGLGPGLYFQNTTTIDCIDKSIIIFVQTDKAKYKPGQTVHFRTFAVYPNLTIYSAPVDIDIQDGNKNRIKQWRGLQQASCVISLDMVLDTQPVLGDWTITVSTYNHTERKVFEVAHYILPKFEVTVDIPSYALTSDASISGKVKARYTYGKPVQGTVSLQAKMEFWYRPYDYHGDQPMVTQTFNISGEAPFDIPISHIKHLLTSNSYLEYNTLVLEANVTENINKITRNGSRKVYFYQTGAQVIFVKSNPPTCKPGLPYIAYLKVEKRDGTPITGPRQDVKLSTSITYELPGQNPTPYPYYYPQTSTYSLPDKMYTVPDNGIVEIRVDIPVNASRIALTAQYDTRRGSLTSSYRFATSTMYLERSYSASNNFIQLLLRSPSVVAGQLATFEIKATENFTNAVYQVLSRGSVVANGQINGSIFTMMTTDKMAPNARMIAYYVRADGEIITDSISFDVDGVFQNKVSIDFDKKKAQPHENVNLIVSADPDSIEYLLAVDQSMLLMKSGNDIRERQVIKELKTFDPINTYDPFYCDDCYDFPERRMKRLGLIPQFYPRYYGGHDAQTVFLNAGVKVLTDATVFHSDKFYSNAYPLAYFTDIGSHTLGGGMVPLPGSGTGTGSGTTQNLKNVDHVRNYFPETWLWTNATVGANGQVTINTTVPDTITSWVASAFAVNSKSGLGVSQLAKMEAFRSFFVSLNLPYSVVRGEQLALQANVFNYMTQDMNVIVTLDQSPDFMTIIVDSHGMIQYTSGQLTHTIHVAAGEAKSVFFPITAVTLGKIDISVKAQSTLAADAVKRQLLVEPEGIRIDYSSPVLVDLRNSTVFNQTVPVSIPPFIVAGSERVVVTAIGDLMGSTVNNLNNLLRMPYGCGEQNMVNFAPDVFITDYLAVTHQLTGDIKTKALNFMEKGYQRELTYQHYDGSFSAFGDRDYSGSMWLTAFVAKSFHQAKRHIYVDPDTIKKAIYWMISRQAPDGHFPEPGHMHNTYMQSGATEGAGLTAYVLISLLENNDLGHDIQRRINVATQRALSYLESRVATFTDNYVLSITTYALKLANSTMFSTAFDKLNRNSVITDNLKHWYRPQAPKPRYGYWSPPSLHTNPIDIEMTAYALLVYAARGDFIGGMPVMKWLTSQRNSLGGFGSTQDTVVGLQALSDFASKMYSHNFNIQATISTDALTHTFSVSQNNALVLQSLKLPTVPNVVNITATGHGFALVDIVSVAEETDLNLALTETPEDRFSRDEAHMVSVSFYIEQEIEPPSFDIQIHILRETTYMLSVETCAKWLQTGSSGMAVQEFGIPTGFEADLESIAGLTDIKRVETENRKVVLYFDEISTNPVCLTLDIIRTSLVARTKPVAVKLYDYYQPSNQVTKFYQSQLLQNSDICDVCEDCGCATV